ncbi:MAG: hypothetical protein VW450_09245 [Chloroflexota bacterium]
MTQTISSLFSRRFIILAVAAAALAAGMLLGGAAQSAKADDATGVERIALSKVEMDFSNNKDFIFIYGSGFNPGTTVSLLLLDSNGVYQDVTSLATSFPMVANDDGAWATKWILDRWNRAGVGAQGVYSLWVTDENFNNVSSHPITLCKYKRAEGEAVPAYCTK